ncbi:hypothetical protein FACS189444_6920 [Spirochaetia bacterium]|nr:hypothetical protein FACS189444_6920 [Spirochaetia bacterium]
MIEISWKSLKLMGVLHGVPRRFLESKEHYRKRLLAAIRVIGKKASLGSQNKE